MKGVVKITAMLAFMLMTSTALAKDIKTDLRIGKEEKSVFFSLDTSASTTTVRFLDDDGRLIFSDKVEEEAHYNKTFDLQKLDQGSYFFSVDDKLRTITYTIELTVDEVRIVKKEESNKPVFRVKDKKVFLNLLNLDGSKVYVKVVDSSDRVLFREVFEDELLVEKAFNFEKAFEDRYTLIVADERNTYYETLVIR